MDYRVAGGFIIAELGYDVRERPMLVGAQPRRVAIVGGVRIPFVRGNGAYSQVGNQEMLTATLRGKYTLAGRPGLLPVPGQPAPMQPVPM